MYEHLLVPVDDSDLSDKAIEDSIGLAKMLGAAITGFTVERPLPPMVMEQVVIGYDPETITEHQAQCETHARQVLKRFADRAVAAGVPFDGQFTVTDNVQQAIVDTAQRQKCDLIVMASHGRHGLDALINGSLTKSVLSHSKLPLLIIH
ncbi:MAG: universal stress protein [Burkholderiales bacterium]|nr:universal stress protein [Burkholderiales bacterium]